MSAADRLARAVPPKVREVCTTIAAAGHQAVIVGGCVRDVLMGRSPGDWDVASSARPEEVIALFKRTIPQGLQHGTVKVMMGKGKEAEVEVTAEQPVPDPEPEAAAEPHDEPAPEPDAVVEADAEEPSDDRGPSEDESPAPS